MEVSDHGIHYLIAIAGCDKEACMAFIWLQSGLSYRLATLSSTRTEVVPTAMTRPPAARVVVDQFSGWCIQLDLFAMHLMLADILTLNGTECVQAHMQCDEADAHALLRVVDRAVRGVKCRPAVGAAAEPLIRA